MSLRVNFCLRVLLLICMLSPVYAWAGTVVRVNTPLGEFFVEMFDDTTPGTVENFLHYVNGGLYNGTMIHRMVPGFVIQGGLLVLDESTQSVSSILVGPNIQNEFKLSNLRGTIAMAKVPGDPNSANSQWFINLADNTSLDTNNGGFTVFGRIMGNGMQIVDSIAALRPLYFRDTQDPFPSINYTEGPILSSNVVNLNMAVVGRSDGLPAVFTPEAARLRIFVNAGELGLLSVEFNLISENPNIVIKLDPASLFQLENAVPGMSVFNNATGVLTIPELYVNGAIAWRNLRFQLTNADEFIFTLTSVD